MTRNTVMFNAGESALYGGVYLSNFGEYEIEIDEGIRVRKTTESYRKCSRKDVSNATKINGLTKIVSTNQ